MHNNITLFRFSSCTYSSKPKCRRWSVAVFSYIMDTTRVNIHTLIALNTGKEPRKVNSFDFGRKLAMDLLTPHLYSRELTGVPQHIILKTYLATGDARFLRHVMKVCDPTQSVVDNLPHRDKPLKTGRRCGDCKRDICAKSLPSGVKRTQINGLAKPTTRCEKCGLAKCNKKHLMKVCASCLQEWGQ